MCAHRNKEPDDVMQHRMRKVQISMNSSQLVLCMMQARGWLHMQARGVTSLMGAERERLISRVS